METLPDDLIYIQPRLYLKEGGFILEDIHRWILEYAAANEAVCLSPEATLLTHVLDHSQDEWMARFENARFHLDHLWQITNDLVYKGVNTNGEWFQMTDSGRETLKLLQEQPHKKRLDEETLREILEEYGMKIHYGAYQPGIGGGHSWQVGREEPVMEIFDGMTPDEVRRRLR